MIRNVLEHVAAANPEPADAELSEHDLAERDAIRTMVLASELPAPPVARPRRRRRVTLALAAVATCAAVAVGVTATDRDASFVDRAYAALTAPGLFHIVEEVTIDAPPVALKDEPFEGPAVPNRKEVWYDRADHASHFILSEEREGRLVPFLETAWKDGKSLVRVWGDTTSEMSQPDDESTRHDESKDPTPPTDYYAVSLFEDAYRQDKVRDDGEVTIDGRLVRRLVLDIPPAQGPPGPTTGPTEQVMLFEPDTLYPIQLTITSSITTDGIKHPVKMTTHYRTFERLPETPENRAKLNLR